MAHIGLPGAAENIAYRMCFMVSVAVAGSLGTQALATQAYTQQFMMLVLLFGLATGLSVEIVVGHLSAPAGCTTRTAWCAARSAWAWW
jgi:Na+-driven multidrug efflux pump